MVKNLLPQSTWVVVEVQSGIPVSVKAFQNQELATDYEKTLRESLNPDNDEGAHLKLITSLTIKYAFG